MDEPIENEYFNWLCAKVLERNGRMYYDLLAILHTTEFIWIVPNDSHRAADGVELRQDFLRETYRRRDLNWYHEPCSVLEMLIAFSRRASFQTDTPSPNWFWQILQNLQLDQFRHINPGDKEIINNILNTFMTRNYDRHGYGGMFPMTLTQNDQRYIEIWYQFCEYVSANSLV